MDMKQKVELKVTAGDKNAQHCFNILNFILSVPLKTVTAHEFTKYHFV